VVTGIHADGIARQKLMNALGMTAYLGCMWCWMTGISIARKGVRLLGYSFKVLISRGRRHGQQLQMHEDADILKVTNEEQLARGQAAEQEVTLRPWLGMRGTNVLVRMLWYAEFNRLFFIPFIHTFIRGIFHAFMLALTGQKGKAQVAKADDTEGGQQAQPDGLPDGIASWSFPVNFRLSQAQKKEAAARLASMRVTQDFGRGPMSLGTPLKSATMEDLMRGLDVVFPLQLAGVSSWQGRVSPALQQLLCTAYVEGAGQADVEGAG
jgi:hypothetical protein